MKPVPHLDTQHLETLLTVLATGSFRAAGQALGYAQPTVSQHVRKLEVAVGTALIERRPGRCTATRAGDILRRYAESLVRISTRARLALSDRPLAVGAGSNIGIYLLQPAIRAFEASASGVPVELTIASNPEIAQRLENDEIDVALLEWWDDRPGFLATPWRREPLVVIVDPAHDWATRTSVSVRQLDRVPLLGGEPGTGTGRILREALRASGLAVGRTLGSTEAVKRAVQAGNGVSIVLAGTVAQEVAAGHLVALPVTGVRLAKTLYGVFRATLPTSAPARALIAQLLGTRLRAPDRAQKPLEGPGKVPRPRAQRLRGARRERESRA